MSLCFGLLVGQIKMFLYINVDSMEIVMDRGAVQCQSASHQPRVIVSKCV